MITGPRLTLKRQLRHRQHRRSETTTVSRGGIHRLISDGPVDDERGKTTYSSRFAGIGYQSPSGRLSTEELMASGKHGTHIDLERLTGVHERRVVTEGEDSYTLAVGAAHDALAHSDVRARDIDMIISCSITKYKGGLSMRMEPPLSLSIKEALGATRAINFDLSNACAGTLTGIFILNDLIRRGEIRCGMVVSGEYISQLARNAAHDVRTILSSQLASLTLGDAGVAAILERAPNGLAGISVAGFTTLSDYSRLCLAYPNKGGPGATMYTKARAIQRAAIDDLPPLLGEALELSGLRLDEIDYVIPHQTSARAIRKGTEELVRRLGGKPKHVVDNIEAFGNTASTSHFVALYRYLQEGRFKKGDRIALIALASGLEIGVVVFTLDDLGERYGRHD